MSTPKPLHKPSGLTAIEMLYSIYDGSPQKIGEMLGESKQTVCGWKNRGLISARVAGKVEAITHGKVSEAMILREHKVRQENRVTKARKVASRG
jgi:hypothetical protein